MSSVTMSTTVSAPVSAVSAPGMTVTAGAALRAARTERGVLGGGGGQPGRPGGDQVLNGDEPVVRGKEARQVTDRPAQVPRRRHAPVSGGPLARRLGDQFLPGVVRDLILIGLGRAFRHCLSTPS